MIPLDKKILQQKSILCNFLFPSVTPVFRIRFILIRIRNTGNYHQQTYPLHKSRLLEILNLDVQTGSGSDQNTRIQQRPEHPDPS